MDENDVKTAVAAYRAGATVRALASAHGVSYGTMYRRLHDAGVTFRPRGSRGVPTVTPVKRVRLRVVK